MTINESVIISDKIFVFWKACEEYNTNSAINLT